MVVLWDDDDGAFLALYDSVNSHLLFLILSAVVIASILQNFQQSFEGFVWTSQAAGLGTGRSLKSVDEIDDLQFWGQRISF